MKILITGATGFIGKYLVDYFYSRSEVQLFLYVRNREKASTMFKDKERIELVTDLGEVSQKHFEAVINLAGENIAAKRWSEQRKEELKISRIVYTQNLIDSLLTHQISVDHFLQGSAVGYYGDTQESVDEMAKAGTDFLAQLCIIWEEAAAKRKESFKHLTFLRTSVVLGDGGALEKMLLPFKMGTGGRLGNGEQYMSWIHIKDFAHMIDYIIQNKIDGPVNMVAPKAVTNKEFTKTLGKVLKRPTVLPVPEIMLRTLLGEMASMLLVSSRVSSCKLAGYEYRFASLESAIKDLV